MHKERVYYFLYKISHYLCLLILVMQAASIKHAHDARWLLYQLRYNEFYLINHSLHISLNIVINVDRCLVAVNYLQCLIELNLVTRIKAIKDCNTNFSKVSFYVVTGVGEGWLQMCFLPNEQALLGDKLKNTNESSSSITSTLKQRVSKHLMLILFNL